MNSSEKKKNAFGYCQQGPDFIFSNWTKFLDKTFHRYAQQFSPLLIRVKDWSSGYFSKFIFIVVQLRPYCIFAVPRNISYTIRILVSSQTLVPGRFVSRYLWAVSCNHFHSHTLWAHQQWLQTPELARTKLNSLEAATLGQIPWYWTGTDAKKIIGIITWSLMRASRLLGGTGHIQCALVHPYPCHEPPVGYFHPHTLPKCHHGSSAGDGSRTGHAAFPHPPSGLHPKRGRLRAGGMAASP